MQRYFCDQIKDNIFTLSKEDSYHITKVMRYQIETPIEVVYNHHLYIAHIITLSPIVCAKVIKEEDSVGNSLLVTVAQSLVKEQKMDYILQKGTELGAKAFIPLQTDRSIVKLDQKKENKINRWRVIVKEASEQAKRLDIPEVTNIHTITDLISLDYDYKILCTVNEMSKNIKTGLSNIKESDTILIVVGPEGGFTSEEEQMLIQNGFLAISLGNRVLRTETASLFVLSIINYIWMR